MLKLIFSLIQAKEHLLSEILTVLIYLTIICILSMLTYFNRHTIGKILENNTLRRFIYVVCFCILLVWQVIMITNLTTFVGWDPQQTLLSLVARPKMGGWLHEYLSYYPNNLAIYYLFAFIQKFCYIFHIPFSMFIINYFNMFIIDLSLVLLCWAIRVLTNKISALIGFVTIILLFGFSPWIIVTYTDTLSLLPVSFGILAFALLIKGKSYIAALLLGIAGSLSYFVKPSSAIYYIAAIIVLILTSGFDKSGIRRKLLLITVTVLSTIIVSSGLQLFNTHQTMYPLDSHLTTSPTQYLMMGAQGNGGYSLEDVLSNINDPDKQSLPRKNINEYLNRVKKMGIFGYLKFLANKFYQTNSDGSFGWGTEGGPDFINQNTRQYSDDFGGLLRRFYWPLGDLAYIFFTIAQMSWILITILLLLSFKKIERLTLLTKNWLYLTIIGANVFLLLFEAGRSRFLIQFLPVYIIPLTIVVTAILYPQNTKLTSN
ncbi:MAG: hypothetical protein J6573_02540 [Lactobacillus sp.]|nr:hypothetical protein [Lactobacillus sp.]